MVRSTRQRLGALLLLLALVLGSAPATADEYDPQRAGHPLRIIAYAVAPVGFLLDYLIFRPAHWLVSNRAGKAVFGHTDEL